MRIAVLAPAPDEPRFAAISGRWLDRLSAALALEGVAVEGRTWVDPGDLAAFDGVTPLLAWSYFLDLPGWAALLEGLAALGRPVFNAAETLRWNTDKHYLAELDARGAPVLPTLFADGLTPEVIGEAHRRFGAELVVKPRISAGAHQTLRVRRGASLDGAPAGPAMLQPFCPSVAGEGEFSLLYFGGRFSHAVVKRAAAGDFRVQFQHGGAYGPLSPPKEALDAGEAVLAAAGRAFTYARVDLIRAPDGRLRLMELEAIEPDLYLEHAPDGGAAFAAAVRTSLEKQLP